ncbi:type VII secretion protein EssC [Staphylococcus pettenkoferi]|uniref:type VII secretion protein EssC n=1 Tax=Staphylococcus pettenkoferi TaxID=170573 RepID=UPI002272508C|nr:type VII secretion protein EssC [Staphylococcus pettenkoferi]MCY1581240.1 type VII secretion protein EssC [Staphylococcus pettenkoferi]
MNKLLIKYQQQVKVLNLKDKSVYNISNSPNTDITISDLNDSITIKQQNHNEWYVNEKLLSDYCIYQEENLSIEFILFKNQHQYRFTYPSQDYLVIGSQPFDDITIEGLSTSFILRNVCEISTIDRTELITNETSELYLNYELQSRSFIKVNIGNHVFINNILIEVRSEGIKIYTHQRVNSHFMTNNYFSDEKILSEESYQRSPRIIHREPTKDIIIEKPPQPIQKNRSMIWRSIIPPLVMIIITVVIYLLRPMGIYFLMMVTMSLVTLVFGFVTYFSNKRKYKQQVEEREQTYRKYLNDKSSEIYASIEEQRYSLNYHFPSLEEVNTYIVEKSPRIYEKVNLHHDFLHYSLGYSSVDKSFEIKYKEDEFNQKRDHLFDEAKELYHHYNKVNHVPLVNDLLHGPIAYVGPRKLVKEEITKMIMQIATFHSYHEVEVIITMESNEINEYQWLRWLPHLNLKSLNTRGFIYNQRTRDQILTSLYSLIKERIQAYKDNTTNEKLLFSPHLILIITDMSLVIDHVIIELINKDLTDYGVSLVFVDEVIESLPEHVKTVIDINSSRKGELIMKDGELVQQEFELDNSLSNSKELIIRRLSNLIHQENIKNTIPDSIKFLEMYQVSEVKELEVVNRWETHNTYKTLTVPIGVRGKDDILELNLHEKAHGPHGLIAGTTGSGKSEIIQTYILSLAVNFHPHQVAFLLIDYKGGGMANLFKDLPHLVGTITNLDGDEAMRALTSIKAELKRRQRLFGDFDVNHINQYHKLIDEGKAKIPMPHLFIISDEFAELKSEQPEFMKELVSTARIGRSLGIHLILATQKPSGVVDEQIWSNSKFKLALKVQNRQDSNEILKTPDAADITQPGRAYLQVGNNEIYELFQSAYSGATYSVKRDNTDEEDNTMYLLNSYGQLETISKDLSGLEHKNIEEQEQQTELEAIIDYLQEVNNRLDIKAVARPWLPPLPKKVNQGSLVETDFKKLWQSEMLPVKLTLGLRDVPEDQYQGPLEINLVNAGNIGIIGSPGYGRTTFLHNIIFNIARHHRPDQAHFYLFDFGTNGLMPVIDLPHVADYFNLDQEEKIRKAIKRINQMIAERKRLLSQARVVNIHQYNQENTSKEPNVFILIDNYDALKDSEFGEKIETFFNRVTREGLALGIHLILTASRVNAIKSSVYINIKTKISLFLYDSNELTSVIGSSKHGVKDIKGRAVLNDDNFTHFQIAQPYQLTNNQRLNDLIEKEIQAMIEHFDGNLPKAIPMMLDNVKETDVLKSADLEQLLLEKHRLPLGLDYEDVEPVTLDLSRPSIITGSSPPELERLNLHILEYLNQYKTQHTVILLDAEGNMSEQSHLVSSYYSEESDLKMMRQGFKTEIDKRRNDETRAASTQLVIINNLKLYVENAGLTEQEIMMILNEGPKFNIHIIITGFYNDLFNSYLRQVKLANQLINQAVIISRLYDQNFVPTTNASKEPPLKKGDMYYFSNYDYKKIKLIDKE